MNAQIERISAYVIELKYERLVDRLDHRYLNSPMTEDEYKKELRKLDKLHDSEIAAEISENKGA